MPILEAQACGCPVLTSNVSSIPEVAGGDAYLVNPTSVQGISEAILTMLTDGSLQDKLKEKGLENIKRFDWSNTVQKLLGLALHTNRKPTL